MSVPQQLSSFNNQIPPRSSVKNITKAYRISGVDYGQILNCFGTSNFTISTVPGASLGAGFNCWVWNSSTVAGIVILIDPNGTETIDSKSAITLYRGEGTQIIFSGTVWYTGSKKTMKLYSENVGSGFTFLGSPSASGDDAVALGVGSTAFGVSSFAAGYNANATGNYSAAFNYGSSASAIYSVAFGNGYAREATKYAFGNGYAPNSVQFGLLMVIGATTNATPLILTADFGAAGSSNQVVLPDASAFAFNILVVARQNSSGGTASAAWKIEGLIRRETGAATTTIVGTPTTTTISNVPGWSIAVSADTTNGALSVTATGAAATNIYWSAAATTNEVTYA
jgi:hypothetical protein